MATKSLQDELFTALNASKSYNMLSPEEQGALKKAFLDASDEQLLRAIEEIKKDADERNKIELEMQKNEEEQIKLAEEIKKTLKEIDKAQLQEQQTKEKAESAEAAEKLLAKIEDTPEETPDEEKPKKRKKWFGLF